ncbi:DUF4440 domain-containing protein [Croceicoccus sp. F390]|uniref:DUF4440 domain-containing protein n=1 Tax=Croceicoccus esteveae TaxID=3075597 RepID=A0ABU2ZDY3_9SPHN|nr:DUF4440 domain-containing protein [Croceicoccus sp. F390]MDT0574811.1 DUF4440 domain-containing protein [Croceicoccus sp. F390]
MDDARIWNFEEELWVGGKDAYDRKVSDDCLMALPERPYVFTGTAAKEGVKNTPQWDEVIFADKAVARPEEGLIVIAYRAKASRGKEHYHALCTSTLRRLSHEEWKVVQHQQTPFDTSVAPPS